MTIKECSKKTNKKNWKLRGREKTIVIISGVIKNEKNQDVLYLLMIRTAMRYSCRKKKKNLIMSLIKPVYLTTNL